MSLNRNLNAAKAAKNDEFYTMYSDIENEMECYRDWFKGKTVYCNCDSEKSNFWKYFLNNFEELGLKRLIATHYSDNDPYILEKVVGKEYTKMPMKGDGDFRSKESIELLKESDVVITNPPFSLFRELVALVLEYGKSYILLGNMNAVAYKIMFPQLLERTGFVSNKRIQNFIKPDGSIQKFGNIFWYSNIESSHESKHNPFLPLTESYYGNPKFKFYDATDILNVDKLKDIPYDYDGLMGVPITILTKYNPEQFEIVGLMSSGGGGYDLGKPVINGKNIFKRIVVKVKKVKEND